MSNSNKKLHFANLVLMLLSLSIVSSIAILTPNNASAQEDQQQRGLLGGLEREQSDEAILGQQPADIGGSTPLNATTTVQDGGDGAQSSACAPPQTGGGAGGGNQTGGGVTTTVGDASTGTTNATNATTAGGGGSGNQSTSSPIQLIEQACMALQGGDVQGAMMQLNLALSQLRGGGDTQGATTGGNASITTGPGGIGTDNPATPSDNPFSDLT